MQLNLLDFGELPTSDVAVKKKRKRIRSVSLEIEMPQQLSFDLEKFLEELPDFEWTDERILELMDWMIDSAVQSIRNRKVNSKAFAEDVAWLYDWRNDHHPFSANNCAKVAGIDIEAIRLGTDFSLPEEKRAIIRLIDNGEFSTRRKKD
jgi:hypothetical protein